MLNMELVFSFLPLRYGGRWSKSNICWRIVLSGLDHPTMNPMCKLSSFTSPKQSRKLHGKPKYYKHVKCEVGIQVTNIWERNVKLLSAFFNSTHPFQLIFFITVLVSCNLIFNCFSPSFTLASNVCKLMFLMQLYIWAFQAHIFLVWLLFCIKNTLKD